MKLDDGYRWPTYFEVHGKAIGRPGQTWLVPVRCGLIALGGDDDEYLVGLGVNDEEPVVLTPEDVRDLREILNTVVGEYESASRQREQKRLDAARQLLDSAVLSRDRWDTLVSVLSDGENDSALAALRECAPQAWSSDIEAGGKPSGRAPGRGRRDRWSRND